MELEFQADDFKRLMFPADSMPDNKDPLELFPKLKKWPEFAKPEQTKGWSIVKKNRIFRYIVFMYDKESPFRFKINDVIKRKLEVAKYVRLIENLNTIDPEVKDLIRNEDSRVNKMIIAFVRMQRDSQYALSVGLENMFYEDLLRVQQGENPRKPIDQTQKQLEACVLELLNQDNNRNLSDEFFAYIEEERINELRPEGIAELFSQGKPPAKDKDISYGID